jgi:VIT1/CCC1 family predicted Fe2+/Mn2+ transporter
MNSENSEAAPASKNHMLKQAVIGVGDGLMITFGLATMLSHVYADSTAVLKLLIAAGVAGAVLLGVGGYLSARYRMQRLTDTTKEEEDQLMKQETDKTISLFKTLDLGPNLQSHAIGEIEKENEEWKKYLEENEQEFEKPRQKDVPLTALIIGAGYMVGALLAIIPFFINTNAGQAFRFSLWINIPLLFMIGFIKSKVNGEPLIWGSIRLALLGSAVVGAAYMIARIFIDQ